MLSIERASDADSAEIGELHVTSRAEEIGELFLASRAAALPYLPRVHSDEETRAWIRDVRLQQGETWVARVDGRVVGFLSLDGEILDQLYVLPEFFRQRVGTLLLQKAKERSPSRLELFTFQRNARARAFYEANDFHVVDLNDGSRNEEGEPDVRYEWIASG